MELKRDIEQKSEENKQLAQNIQYLKKDLKETQLALNVVSLDKEEMDKSIQDILRHWSDESDNITKCMDQFETTTDMIEFLKNKIDQLKGLASMKDTPAILQSLNLLRDSVMQLQSDEEISHDRTNTATDAKSGQAVVDFVIKHIFGMNEKLRDLEHKVGENKQLEQHVQQLKRELEDRKLASRDIEKKIGENKRLEQNIQQLKDELEKSKLASSELSIEKEMIDRSIEDLLMIWSHESDNITKPIDQFETLMEKIEFLKNKIDQLKSLNSLAERVKETEMCSSGNGVMDKEVFMKDTPEILQSLNLLRESVMQLQSAEDRAHARTSIATDTKSGLAVGDFVMKHIFGMNEKLIKLESELNVEIEKRTDLIHKGATEAVITRDTKYKDEMEAKTVMLEKLENSNFNLDEKIKDLQAQILQCKQQNRKIAEENHIFCKERDELKNRVKSMEKLFNEKENEFSRMSAAVANINKSVAEKQKQIIVIQEDRDNKKHAIHELQSQLKQMQKTVLDLQRMNAQQKGLIQNQEEIISTVRCEKDELQTRLSSVAGEKLTKGNPSITDLGDPNRPMKISEKYGELYDNEWTDAMDNNKAVKECYKELADSGIEEIIIHHLHRLLKCCYKECLAKADEQIQTLGKAFAETMCLTFDSEEEILSLPVCKEASMFRRAKSVDFAKLLFENKMLCRNVMDDWNYNYKNEKVMQLLMTSSFFEKCVYICWSMAIQDPVMYLDEDVQAETQIDKNTYKEFVKSGNTVAFVVWPALFLHKDGPLLYKGVVQAYWK
ncbi:uncharacterized protein LOC143041881 [Mytilus galloprovincialis]|uniref:uncharacterized protein LOC143041881 n=1 Tax=Mytilus galloprovincialis TaxID=29158 RepID=UPI003F7C4D21